MKNAYIKITLFCMAIMILLSGCRNSASIVVPIDPIDYEPKKEECIQSIINNKELIEGIIQQMESYDFDFGFWCDEGNVRLSPQLTESQRQQLQSNDKLINDLHILFQHDYIDGVTKSKIYDGTYSYSVDFITIANGYYCYADLVTDPNDAIYYDEHITGDWYYNIVAYE